MLTTTMTKSNGKAIPEQGFFYRLFDRGHPVVFILTFQSLLVT